VVRGNVGSGVETDGVLIGWSVQGRPDAFVEVVQRHEVVVHGFLARRAGRQVADDLLGEVWVRAFAARGGYDPGYADARPWLYGIARNVLRAHWRAGRSADHLAAEEAVDPWDDVVDRLDSAVRAQVLVSAVRALPPGERDVLSPAIRTCARSPSTGRSPISLIPATWRWSSFSSSG
jgi:RNA polymerase sigma factor (sigma-70 family)